MNKDVIYIDVDDDITAVIGKLKDSKEKVVALVPPKRVGMLQSAVNLRLLDRAAHNANKHLVLITNNQALIALAAAAKLPVAKNLQSKPELPEIAALEIDDGDDVIDGADLPVGDHARFAASSDDETETDKAAAGLLASTKATPPVGGTPPRPPKSRNGSRVPNFDSFRKKLFIGIGAGILGVAFLIWAIFFAAHATVVITARTSSENVSKTVALNQTGPTSFSAGVIKSIRQEQKKSQSVEFDATGEENKGEKATGTVKFSNNSLSAKTVPAGTQLSTSGGLVYVTDAVAQVPAASFPCGDISCPAAGTANVGVTAQKGGASYNGATGSLQGSPSSVSASFTGATGGGTDRIVKIVVAADVQKAAEQLATQEDPAVKAQLKAAFGKDVRVIDTSYAAQKGDPVSVPAVGQESPAKAKLTTEITYSMVGVAESELSTYLDAAVKEEIADQPNQRVYDNGAKTASFTDFVTDAAGSKARLVANGKVGPKINDDDIKEKVKGKQYGDIQADIGAIQGVDDVDTKFWPFWVRSVPNDTKRITIEFKLNEQK